MPTIRSAARPCTTDVGGRCGHSASDGRAWPRQTGCVSRQEPSGYGDRHAAVYDRIYGARFAPDAAVEALVRAAAGGRVLELGLGTGRLAIPLVARGVEVDGIEASGAMIAKLRMQPGGERVGVFRADLADFELPRRDYAVAVCAVSTLFMLTDRRAQRQCMACAARHLRPNGRLFIEAFRPDPARFDAAGGRTEIRRAGNGTRHVVRSRHDAAGQLVHISHLFSDAAGSAEYDVTLHYATCEQLDAMAAAAALRLAERWHDWTGAPATEASNDPVSVYVR